VDSGSLLVAVVVIMVVEVVLGMVVKYQVDLMLVQELMIQHMLVVVEVQTV
tara:strand:+ start:250 stop:402 length:153 start_codon:yes stop_codon:yes gene_type:complete